MPAIPANSPTLPVEFIGLKLTAPLIFAEGAILTANEAKFLSRAVISTIGNQYAGDVRRALGVLTETRIKGVITAPKAQETALAAFRKSGAVPPTVTKATVTDLAWDHQTEFNTKFTDYTLGVSNRGGDGSNLTSDPVKSLARRIADTKVRELIKSKGRDVKPYTTTKQPDGRSALAHLVDQYLTNHPEVMDTAKEEVARMQAAATAAPSADDNLDLDLPTAAPSTDQPQAQSTPTVETPAPE